MDTPNQAVIDTVAKIFAYVCITETVTAILLNPLVLIICLKSKRLRSTSTFKILAVSAVNDMLVCLPWNQENFCNTILNYYISYEVLFVCRWISVFLQYTTFNIQSWILLSISVDRLLSMVVKRWSKFHFSGYRPYIYSISLCVFMAAVNFHEVFTSGYSYFDNDTQSEVVICYASDPSYNYDWYVFAAQFALYFGFLIPVGILFIVNLLIIFKATKYSRLHRTAIGVSTGSNFRSEVRKAQMTKMILFITFLYITLSMSNVIIAGYFIYFLSMPNFIVGGYFYVTIYSYHYGQMVTNIVNAFQALYPSLHIFILYFSNKQFANEVKFTLLRMKRHRIGCVSFSDQKRRSTNKTNANTRNMENINSSKKNTTEAY